jgi:putative FmdB family regulatory protein
MPLYEYECTTCHRRTEKIQKYSDAELTICPHCGGPLARTITAPAFQFAGGGWYKDGYGSAKPASGDSGSGESSSKDSGSSGSGDSSGDSATLKPAGDSGSSPAASAPGAAASAAPAPAAKS